MVSDLQGVALDCMKGQGIQKQTQRMASHQCSALKFFTVCLLFVLSIVPTCMASTRYFYWEISLVNYTRNCATKPLVVVNGQYPGPTVYVNEGDRVHVSVKNSGNTNATIHWHGIRQYLSCWEDGTGYITECPVQPGNTEIYDFVVDGQRGTTLWHAHVLSIRATVHGAFITLPKGGYPFPQPYKEFPVILGEWWNKDVETLFTQGLASGGLIPTADTLTLNGLPGAGNNCSDSEGSTVFDVRPGKTYLLRIINAALETEFFFAIANHTLTVVEADSEYVKPFTVDKGIDIAPGQTINVLVTANQVPGNYYIYGKGHSSILVTDLAQVPAFLVPFVLNDVPLLPTTALFRYKHAPDNSPFVPAIPATNDSVYGPTFQNSLKSLVSGNLPTSKHMRHLFYTVGFASSEGCATPPCALGAYSTGAMINNISFVPPTVSILQAYYYDIPDIYSPTFPDMPRYMYNYTAAAGPPIPDFVSERGTRVTVVEYGTVIQLILQEVNNFGFINHPFHLHGHFFYVLGQGPGNYNASKDPANFNYKDPPARFTITVPARGWVAIRFLADNPGAWFLHCHIDRHQLVGMATVFIVKDGEKVKLPGPKRRLNKC